MQSRWPLVDPACPDLGCLAGRNLLFCGVSHCKTELAPWHGGCSASEADCVQGGVNHRPLGVASNCGLSTIGGIVSHPGQPC